MVVVMIFIVGVCVCSGMDRGVAEDGWAYDAVLDYGG